ncbi:MAG: cbb3-type cytochrome c oxidase subunit I [Actinomycetota bacterium]|nr:cbb3-type cytochrome c oxidase subunit I [Actinomycetota bacterium]MDQ3679516.1 cbb3-type cytochrome c oxidase subunit I [Actinomycetota bacterium]
MTITETRPGVATEAQAQPAPARWVGTADHKRLGVMFMAGALVFLLVGAAAGAVLRAELASEGVQLDIQYPRLLSLHASVATLLFLLPGWIGLATWLVPLQIGATRLAFPRLHAFALWLFLIGGTMLLSAYALGRPAVDLALGTPRPAPDQGANVATGLAVMSMALVSVSTVLAAMNLAVTVLKLRHRGLTLLRLPLFAWAMLVTSLAVMLATPVFLGGLALLYLDRHFGGDLFLGDPAGRAVWRHSLWLFGRPEAFLVLLPGLGAACDIVATHARRPLLGEGGARRAVALFAVLSFATWAAGAEVADALVLPTYSVPTSLVALPVALVALALVATTLKGRPRLHVSLLFVGGFLALTGSGVLHAGIAAAVGVRSQAWSTGHLHTVAFGGPTMLLFAALYHWAPKMTGRHPSPRMGGACFLGLFGGFALLGLGSYLLGYDQGPTRLHDYPFTSGATTFNPLALLGAALVVAGLVAFAVDVLRTCALHRGEQAGDDPYGGLTLEWATPSPPPPQNFVSLPEVRSAQPLLDLRMPARSDGRG